MSKHTLFLLLALTIQVFNGVKLGDYTLKECDYVTIDGATSDQLIEELEEDYCAFLKQLEIILIAAFSNFQTVKAAIK